MTAEEKKAQWQDPWIRELLMDLKASIITRYLNKPTPRKKVRNGNAPQGASLRGVVTYNASKTEEPAA